MDVYSVRGIFADEVAVSDVNPSEDVLNIDSLRVSGEDQSQVGQRSEEMDLEFRSGDEVQTMIDELLEPFFRSLDFHIVLC
jgi:hypothetical protein